MRQVFARGQLADLHDLHPAPAPEDGQTVKVGIGVVLAPVDLQDQELVRQRAKNHTVIADPKSEKIAVTGAGQRTDYV